MRRYDCVPAARPTLSEEDWQLILSAVGAYWHNTRYRTLLIKLKALHAAPSDEAPDPEA